MRTIRAAVIDEAWRRVNTPSPDEARSLAERMQHEQPFITPLLGGVVEALMHGNTDEPALAPEHLGLALIRIKTVIDCLDR